MSKKERVLDATLSVRINEKDLDAFAEKSVRTTGKPYQLLLREIMAAFVAGRLRIIPTKEQNGELYNANN